MNRDTFRKDYLTEESALVRQLVDATHLDPAVRAKISKLAGVVAGANLNSASASASALAAPSCRTNRTAMTAPVRPTRNTSNTQTGAARTK